MQADSSHSQPPEQEAEQLITRQQLASRHQVSIPTIKRREKAGLLKPLLIGGTIRYRMADILEFERRCTLE